MAQHMLDAIKSIRENLAMARVDATQADDNQVINAFDIVIQTLQKAESSVAESCAEIGDDDLRAGLTLTMFQTLLAQEACIAHIRHERYHDIGDQDRERANITIEQVMHTIMQVIKGRMTVALLLDGTTDHQKYDHDWHQK